MGSPSSEPALKKKKFTRPRSRRACFTCRERKVKCDADLTFPAKCTNCVQFGIPECVIPDGKRKRRSSSRASLEIEAPFHYEPKPEVERDISVSSHTSEGCVTGKTDDGSPLSEIQILPADCFPKPNLRAVQSMLLTEDALGLFKDATEHYVLDMASRHPPEPKPTSVTTQVLQLCGCFSLPSEELCWKYIDCFFRYHNSMVPLVIRKNFMKDYKDLRHPPSLLLLETILYSGATVMCDMTTGKEREFHEHSVEELGNRVKALFNADLETDPIALCQSYTIFVLPFRPPLFGNRKCFYWIHAAITTMETWRLDADQDKSSYFTDDERKVCKRIFWALFALDNVVSLVTGYNFTMHLKNTSVSILTEADLDDDEFIDSPHRHYLLGYLKLCVQLSRICDGLDDALYRTPAEKFEARLTSIENCYRSLPDDLKLNMDDPSGWNICNCLISFFYHTIRHIISRSCIIQVKHDRSEFGSDDAAWKVLSNSAHTSARLGALMPPVFPRWPLAGYCVNRAALTLLIESLSNDPEITDRATKDLKSCIELLQGTHTWSSGLFASYVLKEVNKDRTRLYALLEKLLPAEEFYAVAPEGYEYTWLDKPPETVQFSTNSQTLFANIDSGLMTSTPMDTMSWLMENIDTAWEERAASRDLVAARGRVDSNPQASLVRSRPSDWFN